MYICIENVQGNVRKSLVREAFVSIPETNSIYDWWEKLLLCGREACLTESFDTTCNNEVSS